MIFRSNSFYLYAMSWIFLRNDEVMWKKIGPKFSVLWRLDMKKKNYLTLIWVGFLGIHNTVLTPCLNFLRIII